jgi:UDP-glucose 6-dehydrogenase
MTGEHYKQIIKQLGLNQRTAAEFLGISLRHSQSYAGGYPIPKPVRMLLKLMIAKRIKPESLEQ